jgi:MFS family permease
MATSKRLRNSKTEAIILWGLIWSSISVLFGYFIVALTPINTTAIWRYGSSESLKNLTCLIIICLALFASFIGIGIMISALFSRRTEHIGKLYFADLFGAGLACLLVVFLLFWIGPVTTILIAGLLLALTGLRLILIENRSNQIKILGGVVSSVFVILLIFPGLLPNIQAEETKTISETSESDRIYSGWGGIFRVDVLTENNGAHVLMHDGMFGSAIHSYNGDPSSLTRFETDPRLFPFTNSYVPRQKVLIIGAAGGNEILASLYFDAQQIDAIELNPITHSLVTNRFADFAGYIAEDPKVNYVQGDGRSFLTRSEELYDLIWFPAPDSYSATNAAASGAFVLSESYLYTVETITESFKHLGNDGIIVAQFGELRFETKSNRTNRYTATARAALEKEGIKNPNDHIVVIQTPGDLRNTTYSTIMIKALPFTPEEIESLKNATEVVRESSLVYAPHDPKIDIDHPAAIIASTTNEALEEFFDSFPYDVRPVTDSKPFFWHFAPFSMVLSDFGSPIDEIDSEDSVGERVLILLLGLAVILGAIFMLLPFITIKNIWKKLPKKGSSILYFAFLGLGFMFFEISLIQRLVLFLGFPTYSLTVTLASILIFTGIGALLSERFSGRIDQLLKPLATAIILLTVFYLLALPAITNALLSEHLLFRVITTFIILAPLGLTLGMFMPLGLKAVSELSEFKNEYVAWGWAINGFASVVGAVLTTTLAMAFGFTTVLLLALITYLLALVSLRSLVSYK